MAEETPSKVYKIEVHDNFHYMDEDECYTIGPYPALEVALAEAKAIVDEYLTSAYQPNMSATQLYSSYTMFGEDPFIFSEPWEAITFSAWDYAKQRCEELCGSAAQQ